MASTRTEPTGPRSPFLRDVSPSGRSDASDSGDEANADVGFATPDRSRSKRSVWGRVFGHLHGSRRESRMNRAFGRWRSKNERPVVGFLLIFAVAILAVIVLTVLLIYYTIHLNSLIPKNDIQRIVESWGKPDTITGDLSDYPTSFSQDIVPIPCHSHNDYLQHVPLYDALAAGCTSIEADIWYSPRDLLVGHTLQSLTEKRTLRSLYIDPLVNILSHQNPSSLALNHSNTDGPVPLHGIFDSAPTIPLILFIDIKTEPEKSFQALSTALEPLRSRGWLTSFNGTSDLATKRIITVVASGETPFDLLTANSTYRDIFFDAPLADLFGETAPANNTKYTAQNSYYASTNFEAAIGKLWHGVLTPKQVEVIRGQTMEAQKRGLKVRYWNTPSWPRASMEHVWDVLEREGVDALSVDDLQGASKRKWLGH